MIRVTPTHTNRCVLNPAGLPLLSLSHPISPPKTAAINSFPNTVIKYVFLLPFYCIINWRGLCLTGFRISTYIYLSVCKIKGMMAKEAVAVILAVDKNTHIKSYQRFYHIFAEDLSWAERYNFRF
jgi:hypothetical protein